MQKAAIFVDIQNIYYTVKEKYNSTFNYKTFIEKVKSEYEVIVAIAYAIDRGDSKQKQFQNTLESFGFTIKLKQFIKRSDGSTKGDWDVGITIDVLEYAPQCNRIIMLTGDGDFSMLIDKVIEKYNVSVDVYGVPTLIAESLINSADNYYPITKEYLIK